MIIKQCDLCGDLADLKTWLLPKRLIIDDKNLRMHIEVKNYEHKEAHFCEKHWKEIVSKIDFALDHNR